MRPLKLSAVLLTVCITVATLTGCADDLRIQNERQRKEIADLGSKLQKNNLTISQMQRQLNDADNSCKVRTDSLQQTLNALEQNIEEKNKLIDTMSRQLLQGGMALPIELSTMLEDFAKGSDMVTYDADRGIVKFKSDLLFEVGSDQVTASAAASIKALCAILNSEQGKKFDIIIAGHTDDIPIGKPETRAKHPTNWHLSVHRAISVLNMMKSNEIDFERMSVRGFGEYRPLEPNAPGNKGNPQHRRVEIYIVPKGV
jgi:chemotaxis protein MotB